MIDNNKIIGLMESLERDMFGDTVELDVLERRVKEIWFWKDCSEILKGFCIRQLLKREDSFYDSSYYRVYVLNTDEEECRYFSKKYYDAVIYSQELKETIKTIQNTPKSVKFYDEDGEVDVISNKSNIRLGFRENDINNYIVDVKSIERDLNKEIVAGSI